MRGRHWPTAPAALGRGGPDPPCSRSLALFIFPLLMAYAASSDLLTMRIANWLVLALAVAYFALALVAQHAAGPRSA